MNGFIVGFIILYIVVLVCYFFTETSKNLRRRVINKCLLSSLFLILAIVAFINTLQFDGFRVIFLLAIIFAFAGDIFLLFSFTKGGTTFIISNILFFISECVLALNNKITIINTLCFIPIFLFIYLGYIYFTKSFDYKNKKMAIYIYLFLITLNATFSIPLAISVKDNSIYLMSIGMNLFMISDYLLVTHKFKYPSKKWLLRSNSATYFIGLLLLALSLMY